MSLTSWRGGNRRDAFDPYSFDVWDPFDFTGSLWEQFTPRDRQGGAQDAAAIANTQIDWKETLDAHIFKADLPGMRKDEVKVQIEEGRVLQIHGERTKEDVQNNDKWHRVERQHGSFMRRFRLPDNAKLDEVKATMEDGVLTVTVPKAPHPKPEVKAIDINSSG